MSYSPVPGMYVSYDYSNAQRLGDVIFPGRFTITEAGQSVAEAQVDSLKQPAAADAPIFTPVGLNPLGVGFPLTPPWQIHDIDFGGTPTPNAAAAQFVVVCAMVSPDGSLSDAEVVASSNPDLNQKALARAARPRPMMQQDAQNGATPQSHEEFFTTLFVTN